MYPALSILQALAATMPTTNNLEEFQTLWVGGEGGMEEALVQRANIAYEAIPAAGLHGVGLRSLPTNLLKLSRGLLASRSILRRFRPDTLLFTGGYVATPLALAARLLSKKSRPRSLVYVPDIEPGLALKTLLRLCDHAALTTEDSRQYLPAGLASTISGYPLRADLQAWIGSDRSAARNAMEKILNLPNALAGDTPILLIIGGSKGARSINQAVLAALETLLPRLHIIHLTGNPDWETVQAAHMGLPEDLRLRYHPMPYLHEMGPALAAADLVLSRAGASSLGEYPVFGLPAILVPYPYAWRYQRVNAEYLSARGAAVMVRDEELADQLVPQVLGLIGDAARRGAMNQAMARLARPNAAQTIAALLNRLSAGQETAKWSA